MRRELAEWAEEAHQLSQRRAARLIPVDRMTLRYEHHRDPQDALRVRLRELAGSRVRYGYRRLTVLLKREGWEVNAKRIYRIYTEEGLIVRTQKRKERAQRQRVPLGEAARPNHKWSMDFVLAATARRALDPGADGRRSVHPRVPDAVRRYRIERGEGGRGLGQGCCPARHSAIDHRRQRNRVRLEGDGPVGLQERSAPGLHPAWQAGRERLHRELQRQAARRMPERGSLLHPGRCSPQAGLVAP